MGFARESDREQTMFWTLDGLVAEEAMVRVIDRFIDVTDLEELKFKHLTAAQTGRPRYPTHANCANRRACAGSKNGYRTVTRSQYSGIYEEAHRNFKVVSTRNISLPPSCPWVCVPVL